MKKLDKITKISNVILGVLYIPFSMIAWLMQMASETPLYEMNEFYKVIIDIFCLISAFIPAFCVLAILLSVLFRKKGYSVWAFIIQFLPIIIFIVNIFLVLFTDLLT